MVGVLKNKFAGTYAMPASLTRMRQITMIDELEVLTEKPHWALVEGPAPGETEFLGRWLLAAVEADSPGWSGWQIAPCS
jgi:hypothetical protein